MSCGMCGGHRSNPRRYKLTLPDGTETIYLSEVEARVAATQSGGGTITTITD